MDIYENNNQLANETAPSIDESSAPPSRLWRKTIAKALRYVGYGIAGALLFSLLIVLFGRWIPPATSSFMIRQKIVNIKKGNDAHIHYRWTRWKDISQHIPLAVVAAEDQLFPHHAGFDVSAIIKAKEENKIRKQPRGASTISQQTAKNLYLWPGRSYFRKALEAYFTILIEVVWSKKRILEVYLNIAEFGPNIYGVGAAAELYWGKKPAQLSQREAALLAAVLPNPKKLHAERPSLYIEERILWITRNMNQLGASYLNDL